MTLRARAVGRLAIYGMGLLGGIGMMGVAAGRVGIVREPVTVQVMEADVQVVVGGAVFDVQGRPDDPLLCYLPPGTHRLSMTRRTEVLCDFDFQVVPNYGATLIARPDSGPADR